MTTPPPAILPSHGKNGAIYTRVPGAGGTAGEYKQIALINAYTLDMATDTVETTAMGDTNKTYVAGLRDLKGTFAGFWSADDDTIFDMIDSPTGVDLVLFPDIRSPEKCFSGPAWIGITLSTGVGAAVTFAGTFTANGSWHRNTNCDAAIPASGASARRAA
jgi:hypothetical protein